MPASGDRREAVLAQERLRSVLQIGDRDLNVVEPKSRTALARAALA
jgi:hypothetical protein